MRRATFAAQLPAGRTMSSVLDRTEREESAPPARRSLEVGAADDRAEQEADAVAERVLGRLASGPVQQHEHAADCGHDVRRTAAPTAGATIGAAGGALDADSTGQIESARGGGTPLEAGVRREMEAGFGHALGNVRIHTDSRADRLSRQMSARAFTTGNDVFFARGEYDPASAAGRHTLAHELAHTVQDGGTARRKMRGTAEALRSQGELEGDKGKSSGLLRKVTGKLTNWDKIVGGVKAYELEEAKLLAGGKNPDPMALMSAKPGMLKLLTKVQGYIKDWRKANDQESEDEQFDKSRKRVNKKTQQEYNQNSETDSRTKAPRRQAVSMLEPRVGNEMSLLSAKDGQGWLSSLGLSTSQVTGSGATGKGQINETKELHYQTEQGDFSGYFKSDHGINVGLTSHEDSVGIRQVDPNYGARSVALYRLDQLFDAKVTARAEFAVHTGTDGKSRLGTVLETAKGVNVSDTKLVRGGDDRKNGEISLDDPVLQRGLNKLQLLDAISGQLDRHGGNYKVQQDDEGNVSGVTGIDLDMAFGKNMTSPDRFSGAFNYKGLPEFIDAEMGRKILQVKPSDLKDALTGLLPQAEITATVTRFLQVQEAVRAAEKDGRLKDSWGGDSGKGGMTWEQAAKGGYESKKSYQDVLKNEWRWELEKEIAAFTGEELRRVLRQHPKWQEMPKEVEDAFVTIGRFTDNSLFQFDWYHKSPIVVAAMTIVFENDLDNKDADRVVAAIVTAMLTRLNANRIAVEVQENNLDSERLKKEMTEAVQADLPRLQKQFQRR